MIKAILLCAVCFFILKKIFDKNSVVKNLLISLTISLAFYFGTRYVENNNTEQCSDVRESLKCLEGTWHYADKQDVTWEAKISFLNKKKDNFDYEGSIVLSYYYPNTTTKNYYKGKFDIEYQKDMYGENLPSVVPEGSDKSIMIIQNDALVGYQVRISDIYREMFGDGMQKY